MSKASSALSGAGTGAAAGAVLGPWGAAGGAVIGGVLGYLGGSDDKKPDPYRIDPNAYGYGMNMSGQAQTNIAGYNAQGQEYRGEANQSQQRGQHDYNPQGFATNAANKANASLAGVDAARQQQLAALQNQNQAAQRLTDFAGQKQGPSAAQAQLQEGANTSFAQQMAAARSGSPGGQAAALRNAQFQQASIMGQKDMQAAQLRAQEDANYKQQQLAALSQAQQGYGAAAGTAQGLRSGDQATGQLEAQTALNAGGLQTNTAVAQGNQFLQNRQLNDQYSLGLGGLAQGQDVLTQNVYNQQLNANMQEQQLNSANYNAAEGLTMSAQNANTAGQYGLASAGLGAAGQMLSSDKSSDSREKKDKIRAEGAAQALAALSAPYQVPGGQYGLDPTGKYQIDRDTSEFAPRAAQAAALGIPTARFPNVPNPPTGRFPDVQTDMRSVPGYQYQYRDPSAPGAAPGQQFGPMAQDLEQNPATAGAVRDTPNGKMVDSGRIALATVPAIGEQQRRIDELEAQLAALGGKKLKTRKPGGVSDQQISDLDQAYAREQSYRPAVGY